MLQTAKNDLDITPHNYYIKPFFIGRRYFQKLNPVYKELITVKASVACTFTFNQLFTLNRNRGMRYD
jgi:hypothetical protein